VSVTRLFAISSDMRSYMLLHDEVIDGWCNCLARRLIEPRNFLPRIIIEAYNVHKLCENIESVVRASATVGNN
jgi:hypothetical protein